MKLSALKNIGKTIEKRLIEAGIHNAEELAALGSREAFVRLKAVSPGVCMVHLYPLQAALDGVPLSQLPLSVKNELKEFYGKIK